MVWRVLMMLTMMWGVLAYAGVASVFASHRVKWSPGEYVCGPAVNSYHLSSFIYEIKKSNIYQKWMHVTCIPII